MHLIQGQEKAAAGAVAESGSPVFENEILKQPGTERLKTKRG